MKRVTGIGLTLMAMVLCGSVATAERSVLSKAGDAWDNLWSSDEVEMGKIDARALHTLLQADVDMTLLDTRTDDETDARRIGDAKVLTSETSDADLRAALPNKDDLLVLYSSDTRSPLASKMMERLTEQGYRNILYYPGGVSDWESEEYSFGQRGSALRRSTDTRQGATDPHDRMTGARQGATGAQQGMMGTQQGAAGAQQGMMGTQQRTTGARQTSSDDVKMGKIDARALHTLLQADVDMTLLDTRANDETDARRIGDAKVLTSETSDADLRAALPNKDDLLVIYSGDTRSPLASKMVERLTEQGYRNILYYPGGVSDWESEEYSFGQKGSALRRSTDTRQGATDPQDRTTGSQQRAPGAQTGSQQGTTGVPQGTEEVRQGTTGTQQGATNTPRDTTR